MAQKFRAPYTLPNPATTTKLARIDCVNTASKDTKDPPNNRHVSTLYRPVWEVERSDVDMFYALPVFRDDDGAVRTGEPPLVRLDTVEATAKRQVKYLTQAFQTLMDHEAQGKIYRLAVRIHTLSLATDEAAGMVTDVIRMLNKDQRKRVAVEVTDFPDVLSVINMDDITIPLMPFFDTLIARPNKAMTDYTLFANLNYAGVSLDLGDKPIDLKLAGQVLRIFSERAEFRRLPTWVLGLPGQEVAKVARIAGAHALSGAYMDRDRDEPGPPITGQQPFMV